YICLVVYPSLPSFCLFLFFFNLEAPALVAIYNQIFCSFCRIEIKCNRLKNKIA
ncbi:unnamed protein product, partial [Tenebrio molitor]